MSETKAKRQKTEISEAIGNKKQNNPNSQISKMLLGFKYFETLSINL